MKIKKLYAEDYNCICCGKTANSFWPIAKNKCTTHAYCTSCLRNIQLGIIEKTYERK